MMGDDRSQERKALRIHGRVQGVGFRWWTRKQAERLGLAGTVRNCPDGTVEVMLIGRPDSIEEMERRLQQGPPGAQVERVDEMAPPAEGHSTLAHGFRIVR